MKNNKSLLILAGITFVATLFLATGCSDKELTRQEEKTSGQTITFTASMPVNGPATKLELTETNESDIVVKWKAGDKINLCFVSGETVKTLSDVPVINIRENGKTADFKFALPEGIQTPFNLYGVYGAALESDSKKVTFPAAVSGNTLSDKEPVCVMRFAKENVATLDTQVSVDFAHLGSVLSVTLNNCADSEFLLNEFSLISDDENYNWLYNASGQAEYDIVNGVFTDKKEGNTLVFSCGGLTIDPRTMNKFYAWIVPTASPDLSKTIGAKFEGDIARTLPAKALVAGKYYRLKLVRAAGAWLPPTVPSASDLMAYWPMDGNANDVSGNNHNGTIYGGVTPTEDHKGRPNKAYLFDGVYGSYIDLGAWENGGDMTFTFWARWDEFRNWSRIIELNTEPGQYSDGIVISNRNNNGWFSFHLLRTPRIDEFSIPNAIEQGQWDFYAVTITNGRMEFFKNCRFLTSKVGEEISLTKQVRDFQYIGRSSFPGNQNFKGAIDDMRIYNRALTREEVLGLYISTK